jgi:hypothetical protein
MIWYRFKPSTSLSLWGRSYHRLLACARSRVDKSPSFKIVPSAWTLPGPTRNNSEICESGKERIYELSISIGRSARVSVASQWLLPHGSWPWCKVGVTPLIRLETDTDLSDRTPVNGTYAIIAAPTWVVVAWCLSFYAVYILRSRPISIATIAASVYAASVLFACAACRGISRTRTSPGFVFVMITSGSVFHLRPEAPAATEIAHAVEHIGVMALAAVFCGLLIKLRKRERPI